MKANLTSVDICNLTAVIVLKYKGILSLDWIDDWAQLTISAQVSYQLLERANTVKPVLITSHKGLSIINKTKVLETNGS